MYSSTNSNYDQCKQLSGINIKYLNINNNFIVFFCDNNLK